MGLGSFLRDLLFPPKKKYGVESKTLTGETVRSRGEKRIADYFTRAGIEYIYEKEAVAKFFIFSSRISCPDFYLPEHKVYVEYWGMVNVDDERKRDEYIRQMKWKMAQYHRWGVRFISIYPDNLENLDWVFRSKFKKVVGYELPSLQ